jgi:hypothetical protein
LNAAKNIEREGLRLLDKNTRPLREIKAFGVGSLEPTLN